MAGKKNWIVRCKLRILKKVRINAHSEFLEKSELQCVNLPFRVYNFRIQNCEIKCYNYNFLCWGRNNKKTEFWDVNSQLQEKRKNREIKKKSQLLFKNVLSHGGNKLPYNNLSLNHREAIISALNSVLQLNTTVLTSLMFNHKMLHGFYATLNVPHLSDLNLSVS